MPQGHRRDNYPYLRGIGEECPKSTEYCFLESGQPESINDEKWAELCKVGFNMFWLFIDISTSREQQCVPIFCVVQFNHGSHFKGRWLPNMSWNLRGAPPVPEYEKQVRATSLKSKVFPKTTELCNFFTLKYLGAMLSTLESTNTEIHFSHITR